MIPIVFISDLLLTQSTKPMPKFQADHPLIPSFSFSIVRDSTFSYDIYHKANSVIILRMLKKEPAYSADSYFTSMLLVGATGFEPATLRPPV